LKILVYGAGVLGSLYAVRLQQAGQDVTILARGQRFQDIEKYGIVLEHALNHHKETVPVESVEHLDGRDRYDLIIVLVRKNQVASVLPVLAANQHTPNILFMVNNPSGYDEWINAVGSERLLLGFPGAGGTRIGPLVRYVVVSRLLQPTTFGEINGAASPRIREIMEAFRAAGFPVAFTPNMNAWQKTHVAWVSPVANAIYGVNGDHHKLARSPQIVHLLVRGVREGFQVLKHLQIPITPVKLRMWEYLSEDLLVRLICRWADTNHFKTVAVEHTLAAADEMRQLAHEFKTLVALTPINTPALDELRSYIPKPDVDAAPGARSVYVHAA